MAKLTDESQILDVVDEHLNVKLSSALAAFYGLHKDVNAQHEKKLLVKVSTLEDILLGWNVLCEAIFQEREMS